MFVGQYKILEVLLFMHCVFWWKCFGVFYKDSIGKEVCVEC